MMLYTEGGEYVGSPAVSFVGGFQATTLPGRYKLAAFSIQSNAALQQDSLGFIYYDHGRSFADSGAKSVLLAANAVLKLNDCVMERTTGGIAGTVFDRATGKPMTSGRYFLLAFDEQEASGCGINLQQFHRTLIRCLPARGFVAGQCTVCLP